MRILITGAAGFFGKALVRAFASSGDDVLAADRGSAEEFQTRPGTPAERVTYVPIDVADPATLAVSDLANVDGVVHAAALTPTMDQMRDEPQTLVSVNLIGTLNLLEFARLRNCKKFLFVSSAGVYDQFRDAELREEDGDGGFSLYGSAKLAAEVMLWRYGVMYEMDVGAIRPTSMYGPAEEMRPTRPFVTQVKSLVDAGLAGDSVCIDGADARCDWIYVDDVAEAAQRFWSQGMNGRVLNMSSGQSVRFEEVVKAVEPVVDLRVDPDAATVVDGSPDRPAVISNERTKEVLGWRPMALEDGVRRYVDELKAGGG
jgi:nucleoside-diphosphate-sugar epimerase